MLLNKFIAICSIVSILFVCQALTPAGINELEHDKNTNLKVLPKNMSDEDLHALMKVYAKSLGVRCNHCHAPLKDAPDKLDFASDEKPEKSIARKMIKMTDAINKKYISKIEGIEKVQCVTCHNGHIKPLNNVDSLMVK
jgi:hypothetical protein